MAKEACENIEQHTKMRFCTPQHQWSRQKYLTELAHNEAKDLLRFKLNMNDVKCNFKNLYSKDQLCELCRENEETNEHLMNCSKLRRYRKNEAIDLKNLLKNGSKVEMKELVEYLKQAAQYRSMKMEQTKSKKKENDVEATSPLPCTRNLLLTLRK